MNVNATISHLTGRGWVESQFNFVCDENIGLAAGRDKYATARGTAIKLMRKYGLNSSAWAHLVIDDIHIRIEYHGGKFVKLGPAKIGEPLS